MNWTHVLHVLMHAYATIHGNRALYSYYLHHRALGFLRSGYTSGTGSSRAYLHWLVSHHRNPVDW